MGEGVLKADRRTGGPADAASVEASALLADAGMERRDGVLLDAGVPLPDVAGRYGTPTYVYNADVIRRQYGALDRALAGTSHQICFAVKANGNLGVLRVLRDLGAGADIVSAGELARALTAGFDPAKIVFSGVGKRPDELRAAARARIGHVNVESLDEIAALAAAAEAEAVTVDVGIRVNPDVSASTHPYISTGKGGIKFGVPVDQVVEAARRILAEPRLRLTTLAMHIGSQLTDVTPYVQGARRLVELVAAVRTEGVSTLEVLDVGGGLGIRYRDEEPLDPRAWAEAVTPVVQATGLALHLEPGRLLVGAAGVLLARVLYRKHSGGKEFVIVDAGMNDLERPSRYQAYHAIVPAVLRPGAGLTADVVGPVCETGDFFAIDRALAPIDAGDLVAVLGTGAYGFAMASNYNTRPLPAEVIVEQGRSWLARPRQAVEELFRDERVSSEAS